MAMNILPKSYSQAGQDEFAVRVLGAEPPKRFVDVGAGHPVVNSNTYALELLGWTGVCVEKDDYCQSLALSGRLATWLKRDAVTLDWGTYLQPHTHYMSFDLNGGALPTLRRFPFDTLTFGVITIEHDKYRYGPEPQREIRHILSSHDYVMIAGDVHAEGCVFEDWWVSADLAYDAQVFASYGKDWRQILAQQP